MNSFDDVWEMKHVRKSINVSTDASAYGSHETTLRGKCQEKVGLPIFLFYIPTLATVLHYNMK